MSDSNDHDIIMANFPPYFIEPTPRKLDWREPIRAEIGDEWVTPEFEFELINSNRSHIPQPISPPTVDPYLDDLAGDGAENRQFGAGCFALILLVMAVSAFMMYWGFTQ